MADKKTKKVEAKPEAKPEPKVEAKPSLAEEMKKQGKRKFFVASAGRSVWAKDTAEAQEIVKG